MKLNPVGLLFAKPLVTDVSRLLGVCGALMALACASGGVNRSREAVDFGVLVMAHGGTEAWNGAVLDAVRPLELSYPVEVAFGMADAESLQQATSKLEARGVERIGVVRLFVSGESWLERTRQILGLSPGAPTRQEVSTRPPGGGHDDLQASFWRIETVSAFALTREGLSQVDEMSGVLLDRARELSEAAERESVLILAHGTGDDEENARWIAALEELVEPLREEFPFRAVEVQTLREDWDEKREVAEERIRSFAAKASAEGGRCLVIPFRVFGFGPYAEVLEGLNYVSAGRGLLQHEAVSTWMLRQANKLARGPFESAVDADRSAARRQ
jgi:sirohydrochlorin ferrochelatase